MVWWPRVGKVETKNLLKSLQGSYLRAVVGTQKTTPTAALQVALCICPLDQLIIHNVRQTTYRLYCQGEWRDAGIGHTALGFLNSFPFTYKQDRIPRKYQEGRTAEVIIPSREQWRKADFLNGLGPDVWFTDGSGKDNRHGAGIYGPTRKHRFSLPLEEYATVFQAEVKAIAECARIQIADQTSSKKIYICSDSRAAMNALIKQNLDSMTVWNCMRVLSKLGETNKVTLVWTPGHQGIHGNEVADKLAKQ
ncbi:uncharacterized protein [Cardiocondyla obscurior]|uniref:uncharacterized protein n=1 Tax=Cardiocondyla obscurior TaxID=286306 RepID=UPI0039656CE4